MGEAALPGKMAAAEEPSAEAPAAVDGRDANRLVAELSSPDFGHPVKACDDTYHRLVDHIMIHVTFTGTSGGTSLGCEVNYDASDLAGLETGGPIEVVSMPKGVNGHRVTSHYKLDMKTMEGFGHLEIMPGGLA